MEGAQSMHGVIKLFPEEGGWSGGIGFGSEDLGGPFLVCRTLVVLGVPHGSAIRGHRSGNACCSGTVLASPPLCQAEG